jgi:release factor glutamine methyltransferase
MTEPPAHVPLMSPEHAERLRRWHDNAYETARREAGTGDQTFTYLGRTFVVPPQVMPITAVSHLLGEAVLAEVRDDDRVLDMGTGCGVNAILAAATAREVLAVDVSPQAVDAAIRNAERNGVADRIRVRCSDVFSDVDGTFDLIVFDPPFRWFAPRDLLEAASADENYRSLTTFFRQVRPHLSDRGRLLVFFGTSGDLSYLERLADEAGFIREVLAQLGLVKDGWPVEYFTFRMTTATVGPPRSSRGTAPSH